MNGESYCLFGAKAMLGLLEQFTSQENGVREAKDIEFLHRMRVGTRRLREALTLFCGCIDKFDFSQWMKELRKLTRALGSARDLDVQSLSLTSLVDGKMKEDVKNKPGLERLILRLRQKRERAQKTVVKSLDAFASGGVAHDIQEHLGKRLGAAYISSPNNSEDGEPQVSAALHIKNRIADVMGYDSMVRKFENVYEQHEMRKAFKRLRYAMELFEPIYGEGLTPHIKTVKSVQDILGELHDCDVWIEELPVFIEDEKHRMMDWQGNLRGFSRFEAGLKSLIDSKKEARILYYKEFIALWDSLCSSHWWDGIINVL